MLQRSTSTALRMSLPAPQYRVSDPVLTQLRSAINESGLSVSQIAARSGLCRATIASILSGDTARPQNMTVDFILKACGYRRTIMRVQ